MSINQVVSYSQGYVQSIGNNGGKIAGLIGLSLKGSITLADACVDYSGNIYVTDPVSNIILKISGSGSIFLLAGLSGTSGNNGSNTVSCSDARFNYPTGITCDKNGDLYICDTNNHQIRKISNNKVSLVAGSPSCISGTSDGTAARFNSPYGIDIDESGNIYVADTMNHAIRMIKGGVVSTFAGLKGTYGNYPVWSDMTTSHGVLGTDARFNSPYAITVNSNGYVFVSDTLNYSIKRIDSAGRVRIFSGSGTYGRVNGNSKTCRYQELRYMDITKSEELYVIDYNETGASRLMLVNREGAAYPVIDWSLASEGLNAASIVCDQAAHLIVIESDYIEISSSSSLEISSSSSSSSFVGDADNSSSSSAGGPEGVTIGIPEGKTVIIGGEGNFNNGGFETGDFTGWTKTQGYWTSPTRILPEDYSWRYPSFDDCEIVNDFPDLQAGGTDAVFEGMKAARINDYRSGVADDGTAIGYRWSKISQTVTNWQHDTICFAYNSVLQDPINGHHNLEDPLIVGYKAPKFVINLYDETTSTMVYEVATNVFEELLVPGGWKTSSAPYENWKYSDWQNVILNSSALIGHNLTLSISAYDCAWGEHGGYVYVDNVGYLS